MSDPGVAPAPRLADGQVAYQKLLSAGFTAEEASDWRAQQTAKLQGGGFTQPEIDAYWGDTKPNSAPLDQMMRGQPGVHEATNPLEELEAGWQMSVAGLGLRGKMPDTVAPEHAGFFARVLQGTGQFVGDLPATVGGFVSGAAAGTAAGAAVPVAGETGGSEAVGGIAGAGFGAGAMPQAMREVMMDYYRKGEIHTFPEFWAMATHSLWETAKAGVTGAAASLVGGKVGGTILAAGAKPWLATGANMTSQAVTATAVGGALDGRVPNADDFAAGAVTMLGFHAAARAVGAGGGQRVQMTDAGARVQSNLQNIYRRLGVAPWQAVKMAQTDPAIRQEILTQDVVGQPSAPTLTKAAPDEPPLPKKAPFGQPAEAANENSATPLSDLLSKVRALEGSGDQAISPAGAIGRYQIMPGTARQYGFDPEKLTDPAYSERAALTILSDLNRRFRGDQDAILAAYNAGPGRAAKLITAGPGTQLVASRGPHGWQYESRPTNRDESHLPLETQEYLARGRAGVGGAGGGGKEPPAGGSPPPGGGEPPKQIEGPEPEKDPAKMTTESRVASYLDRVGEPPTGHRSMLGGLEMELDAARRVDNALREQGLLGKDDIGIEDMARSTYGSEQRANHFFFKGPIDPITFQTKEGVSLKDVVDEIQRIGGTKDEFNAYRVSLRTIEKAKQGIEAGVIPLAEAQANATDPNLTKYAKANDLMQQFKNGVLEYVRDSGGISQKQMDAMIAANTSHVSLRRIMGDDTPFQGGGKGFKANNPIKRMEGSDRQIVDPWTADIDNARMMIRFADRNRAAGAIAALSDKDMQAVGVRKLLGQKAKAELAEPDSNDFKPYGLDDKQAQALQPFVQQAKEGSANTFTYYRDGKPEVYEAVDPNLARLLRAADTPGEATLIGKAMQAPAAIARAGIAFDPSFGPRIALKHQITAFIADPMHPPPFITMLRGIMDAFGKGDAFWELARTGGLSGSMVDLDKSVLQSDAQKLLDETGVAKKLFNTVTSPLQFAQIISDRLSMASRIGYYKAAKAQGVEPLKAAMGARKAYLDYDEKFIGNFANIWSKWVPFFKADILGLRQGWDAVQPGRLADTALYATLGLVLPSIALYLANREADKSLPDGYKYTDLPQWQRDLYFVTPPIAGMRFRLGKPYNFGPLIGVPLERFIQHEVEKNPHAFDDMWSEMSEPVPLSLPPTLNPVIEGVTNHSFFAGKPLVPDSMKDATGDMQYTENTTEPAKALARLLGPHQLDFANLSPIVIDNYVQDWGGTLGVDAMRAVGAPFKLHSQPWQISDIPFVHSFVVRNPGASAQSIEDFYKDMDGLRARYANVKLANPKTGREEEGVLQQDAPKAMVYQRLTVMEQALGNMRSVVQGVNDNDKMTVDEKRQATDRIYSDMIGIAKTGSKLIQSIK